MSLSSLPVSLLRQWAFCPRVAWHVEVADRRAAEPKWVSQGREWHVRQDELSRRRTFTALGLGRLLKRHHREKLPDNGLGLHGTTDLVLEFERGLAIVEFKIGEIVNRGARLQAMAYGILAETRFGKRCPVVFIGSGLDGKRFDRIELDLPGRKSLRTAVTAFKADMGRKSLPDSSVSPAKCEQCEYLVWCNDRF